MDQLVDAGVDTLFYSAGTEGGVVQYDSRVAAKWGDNVDVWTHEIFYRAARTLHQLLADGIDPMKVLCNRSHEKGLWFLPTVCVCIGGGERKVDAGLGRKSNFAYDHPQFQVGPDEIRERRIRHDSLDRIASASSMRKFARNDSGFVRNCSLVTKPTASNWISR